jgi:CO/xanthine dehydrogenase Mo-binding subunit
MPRRSDFNAVGQNQPRLDGADKVTGRSLFTDDIALPGMLCGQVLRCPLPRARIRAIDTRRAEALPGVKAVVTAKDARDIWLGINQPLLSPEFLNHVGQEVAAVAAVDEDVARAALRLIEVEYEPLRELGDMKAALAPDAPLLHPKAKGNIAWEQAEDHGDPDAAFAAAHHVRTDHYITNPSHNCYAEFHVAVADFSRRGKLTVWTPTQSSLLFQKSLAAGFKLPDSAVRIMCLNSGGGFTGRTATRPHHFLAALLSRKAGRPVKIRATGDEEFIMCRAGGLVEYRFRSGVDRDGRLKVVDADLLFDTGAYVESQMIVVLLTSSFMDALYPVEATRYRGRLVHTNNLPYYFHHGGGLAQFQFAFGQHVNSLALDLDMDPVDFHLLNAVEKGHTTLRGIHYASCGLKECIRKTARRTRWKAKRRRNTPLKGIGIGIGAMASGAKGLFKHDTSAAFIKVSDDGKATLFVGLPDMGQSSHTAMAIIAAEVLGIAPTDITVASGDTDLDPLDVGAFTQRGTFNTGNAVKNACLDARKQIAKTAAAELGVRPSQLDFAAGRISVKRAPDRAMSFAKAVFNTLHSREGRFVMGRGFYNSPLESGSMAYSFGAQIAEVSVDKDTGVVTVERVTAAHDVGRAINPRIVEGQIDGQIFSGMSQALFEECVMDEGQVLNPSRLDYKMPRAWEMPEVEHIIVETNDPYGPFGAKEVGEGPIVCTMQAIANAVADAIGEPVTEMPITPWRVLKILSRRKAVA